MGQCMRRVNGVKESDPQQHAREQSSLDQLFPDFKPLTEASPHWQKTATKKCLECAHPYDFLSSKEHCRSCGRIFCSRCCYPRPAIHNHQICGLCMAGAMTCLRKRELSLCETRARRHSQILRQAASKPTTPHESAGHPETSCGVADSAVRHVDPSAGEEMAEVKAGDASPPLPS